MKAKKKLSDMFPLDHTKHKKSEARIRIEVVRHDRESQALINIKLDYLNLTLPKQENLRAWMDRIANEEGYR